MIVVEFGPQTLEQNVGESVKVVVKALGFVVRGAAAQQELAISLDVDNVGRDAVVIWRNDLLVSEVLDPFVSAKKYLKMLELISKVLFKGVEQVMTICADTVEESAIEWKNGSR